MRKRHNNTDKDMQIQKKMQIYSYRNAVYQGELSPLTGKRGGRGIIYVTDTHHFIAANQFTSNRLNGSCFFFHQHSKYVYGQWRNNQPHGVLVFRIEQILIIAEFVEGKLTQFTKFAVVIQKINVGVVLEVDSFGKLEIRNKVEILNSEDITKMINECSFKQKGVIHHSLIKYLNKCMSSEKKKLPKLRLINNSYYRYGYDFGLAVIFDDEFRLLSAGLHNKNALNSFGVKFHGEDLVNRVQEGVFDGYNTFAYDLKSKPKHKISQLYHKLHLSQLNFKNQVYKDPSEFYFQQIQGLLKDQAIKSLLQKEQMGFSKKIVTSFSQAQDFYRESDKKKQLPFQGLHVNNKSLPNFRKTPIQIQSDKLSRGIKTLYKQQPRENSRHMDTVEFQSLNTKQKLKLLKKQIYENVNHRVKLQQNKQNSFKRPGIITKSIVDLNRAAQHQFTQTLNEDLNFRVQEFALHKQHETFARENLISAQEKQIIDNLQQKIDIVIRNDPSMQSSASQGRPKKRIFDSYSNIKRDYSPQSQVSPFKSRIKSRIFQKTPSKTMKSRSKSPNRIFGNSKTPQKRQTGKFYLSKNSDENSIQPFKRNDSSSQLRLIPVTMQRTKADKPANRQLLKQSKQLRRQHPKSNQKKTIQAYQDNKHENNKHDKGMQEQIIKKSNTVYRNNMKSEYGNYVYEPINLRETGNAPYVQNKSLSKTVSNASLKHNPTQTTLHKQMSKKSIEDSSPNKKEKMGAYMVGQSLGLREAQRLSDFKRRVNYF